MKSAKLVTKLNQYIIELPSRSRKLQGQIDELVAQARTDQDNINKIFDLRIMLESHSGQIQQYRDLQATKSSNNIKIQVLEAKRKIWAKLLDWGDMPYQQEYYLLVQLMNDIALLEDILLKLDQHQLEESTRLRRQFYSQLLQTLLVAAKEHSYHISDFKSSILNLHLPLKRNEQRDVACNGEDQDAILKLLHREYWINCLSKYLGTLIDRQVPSLSCCVDSYWQSTGKAVHYLFLSNGEAHNLEEPVWMFDYLQQVLNSNIRYLTAHLFAKEEPLKPIMMCIQSHFIKETFATLVYQSVKNRMKTDFSRMSIFMVFNFLDQLSQFQTGLSISFNEPTNFVQTLLQETGFDTLLDKNFDYEHEWIEEKVFYDFCNIDYSKINLKNIDAYNIVINFAVLFTRLHNKFVQVRDQTLIERVNTFYGREIMALVAHIKTSFERISKHSGHNKIEIILAFRRVQNEFRGSLGQFIASCPNLEREVEKQYYGFLQQHFVDYGLKEMDSVTKKMIASLNQIHDKFREAQEIDQTKFLYGFQLIFNEWREKMETLNKFSPYNDIKLRNVFFMYLKETSFSSLGFNLYLRLFEPFLKAILNEEGYRWLATLLLQEQHTKASYLDSHKNMLTFLTKEQLHIVTWFVLPGTD